MAGVFGVVGGGLLVFFIFVIKFLLGWFVNNKEGENR